MYTACPHSPAGLCTKHINYVLFSIIQLQSHNQCRLLYSNYIAICIAICTATTIAMYVLYSACIEDRVSQKTNVQAITKQSKVNMSTKL